MSKKFKPGWLDTRALNDAAAGEATAKSNITVNLPDKFKTISSYQCNTCRLVFTSGQIGKQLKKAARTAQSYIECPKCSGFLVEKRSAIVRDTDKLVDKATRYQDNNQAPSRGINTWVDKAIYGKLIQSIADYINTLGISAPQLRFQRSIRSSKFPGEPHSAKAAEFTVEFTDYNNTRNRIIIQAGLTPAGKFIYPRTFKTLSGNEYPLTAHAIEDFTSGKVYAPVTSDYSIPSLNYKGTDPVRFREISANSKRLIKKAYDSFAPGAKQPTFTDTNQVHDYITNVLNISQEASPDDYNKLNEIFSKQIQNPNNVNEQNTQVNMEQAPSDGGFMQGLGLGKRAFQDMMIDPDEPSTEKKEIIQKAVDDGMSFEEAYDFVVEKTGEPLTLDEFDTVGHQIVKKEEPFMDNDMIPLDTTAIADKLIAQAEIRMSSKLHITAEEAQKEYTESRNSEDFKDFTFDESRDWVNTYLDTFNDTLDRGEGLVNAKSLARKTASNKIAAKRIKLALRDKSTLFPITEPNPEYSLAQQTKDSEPRFDMPYDETDGGIPPFNERNISTMFKKEVAPPNKESSQQIILKQANLQALYQKLSKNPFEPEIAKQAEDIMRANVPPDIKLQRLHELDQVIMPKQYDSPIDNPFKESENTKQYKLAESTGIDNSPEEKGQNPMNYSRYKTMIQDYLRAGNIPPTKVDLHKLKDGIYTLDELKDLANSVKTNDGSAVYPTAHAAIDPVQLRKGAESRLADIVKEMPLENLENTYDDDDDDDTNLPNDPFSSSLDDLLPDTSSDETTDDLMPEFSESIEPDLNEETALDLNEETGPEFDPAELAKGIQVEKDRIEANEKEAEKAAKARLSDTPDYYTRLNPIEAEAHNTATDMPSLFDNLLTAAAKKVQNN